MKQFRNGRRIVERNVSNGSLFARPGPRDFSFVLKRASAENTLHIIFCHLFTHLCCRRYHEAKVSDAGFSENLSVIGGQVDTISMIYDAAGKVLGVCFGLLYHFLLLVHSPWLAAYLTCRIPQLRRPNRRRISRRPLSVSCLSRWCCRLRRSHPDRPRHHQTCV